MAASPHSHLASFLLSEKWVRHYYWIYSNKHLKIFAIFLLIFVFRWHIFFRSFYCFINLLQLRIIIYRSFAAAISSLTCRGQIFQIHLHLSNQLCIMLRYCCKRKNEYRFTIILTSKASMFGLQLICFNGGS